jgi:hypothetical protein
MESWQQRQNLSQNIRIFERAEIIPAAAGIAQAAAGIAPGGVSKAASCRHPMRGGTTKQSGNYQSLPDCFLLRSSQFAMTGKEIASFLAVRKDDGTRLLRQPLELLRNNFFSNGYFYAHMLIFDTPHRIPMAGRTAVAGEKKIVLTPSDAIKRGN